MSRSSDERSSSMKCMRSSCRYRRELVGRTAAHTSMSRRNASSTIKLPMKPVAPVTNILFISCKLKPHPHAASRLTPPLREGSEWLGILKAPPPRHLTVAHPSPSERGVNSMGYRIFHFSFFTFPFSRRQPFFYLFTFLPLKSLFTFLPLNLSGPLPTSSSLGAKRNSGGRCASLCARGKEPCEWSRRCSR